jgi:hypothetical protein
MLASRTPAAARIALAAAAWLLAASAPGAAAAAGKASVAEDPNREICKNQSVIGSRLKRVRVCMSALEWEELKLQEQLGLARKQINGSPGCVETCAIQRGGKDTPW